MDEKSCLVLGDINIDYNFQTALYPPEGGRAHAGQTCFRLGGSGCVTAAALNSLGCPSALAGNLGSDMLGDWSVKHIRAAGVESDFVRQLEGQQTGFFVIVNTPGGRQTIFGSRGANALPLPETEIIENLAAFRHLHISGYILAGDDQFRVVQHILACARQAGLTASLDPGVCSSEQAREKILALLIHIDYFLPSLEELTQLAGGLALDDQLVLMLRQGCGAVALKMGELGSRYTDADQSMQQPALREAGVRILNTTGAGDCFNAGFLNAMLSGGSPKEALQNGNAAAFRMLTSPRGILDWVAR